MVSQDCTTLADDEVVERVLGGETRLFELLMRRYNQRLFRAIRSVIPDDLEAEDVLQDAWVRAYEHLEQFESRASFATWITRIALYESMARVRKARRFTSLEESEAPIPANGLRSNGEDPEQQTLRAELSREIQSAVDRLPKNYRSVFVLRDVEGMSTAETADCLDLSEEAVKTRLHRSRALLRHDLEAIVGPPLTEVYPFLGHRCDRILARVMERIARARSGAGRD
ncbi:MAG TPA: RNA polymerase sigma factor [Bryobacteraceae bacterium]|nr:RNA polymerase sigma factor [Bryobacteraceae bacterium]